MRQLINLLALVGLWWLVHVGFLVIHWDMLPIAKWEKALRAYEVSIATNGQLTGEKKGD